MILALLLSPFRKHIATFQSHLRMYIFDVCSIHFWGHQETSTVGAVRPGTSYYNTQMEMWPEEEVQGQKGGAVCGCRRGDHTRRSSG